MLISVNSLALAFWHNIDHKAQPIKCTYLQHPQDMEGIFLFNDALNTFYLRLYGIGSTGYRHKCLLK